MRRAANFDACAFVHESRVQNVEPHNLAKFSSSLGVGRHVWLGTRRDFLNVPINISDE